MKLYGLAIAVVPKKANPEIMGVTCTAVAVDDSDLKKIETIDEHTFDDEFGLLDTPQLMDCFVKLVNALDGVVKLQTQSLGSKISRKVAVDIGEDSRNPININAIYYQLFGERFSPPAEKNYIAGVFVASFLEKYGMPVSEAAIEDLTAEQLSFLSEGIDGALRTEQTRENEVTLVTQVRSTFLDTNSNNIAFIEACEKLSILIDSCTIRKGSYGLQVFTGNSSLESEKLFNQKLNRLKDQLGDEKLAASAHKSITEIAREMGQICAKKVNDNPTIFARRAPKGTENDPINTFLTWHTDYRDAFDQGFKASHNGKYTCNFQVASDSHNRHFVSTVRDRIIDELLIASGAKPETTTQDLPEIRGQIAASARNNAKTLQAPSTSDQTAAATSDGSLLSLRVFRDKDGHAAG